MAEREFTGRHAAAVFIGAFGVIIAVNVALAVSAVSTFPGLETANSYVASQRFDADRTAQEALGWQVAAGARDGRLTLRLTDAAGAPVEAATLAATLGRATHVREDTAPDFRFDGTAYVAAADLAPGNWNLRIEAVAADGTPFRQRVVLRVTE